MSIDKSGARKRNQFRRVQLSILLLSLISLQLVAGPRRRSPQADLFPDGTAVPEWFQFVLTERIINYNSLIINNSGRGVNFTRARRCEKKLSGCHKADISTPGECRGRGPEDTSYHEAMTR